MQTKILHGEGNNKCRISKDDIGKAQEEEKWIWIVIEKRYKRCYRKQKYYFR